MLLTSYASLAARQVKPENNLPQAISPCLGQALIFNPDNQLKRCLAKSLKLHKPM